MNAEIYLIISSPAFDLLASSLRFFTTGTLDGGFADPNTESDATTIDSVKLDVVNFWPRISFGTAFETGVTLASVG